MSLNRPLRAPEARTIITRRICQKHDDLLARGAAEFPFGTRIGHPPTHWTAPQSLHKRANFVQVLYEIPRFFGRFGPKTRESLQMLQHNTLPKTYIFQLVLATPAGFEPATCPLGGGCSIQLSHGAARRLL